MSSFARNSQDFVDSPGQPRTSLNDFMPDSWDVLVDSLGYPRMSW